MSAGRSAPPLWPLWIVAAALAAGLADWLEARDDSGPAAPGAPAQPSPECPPAHLPDDGACVPLPLEPERRDEPAALELLPGRPREHARYLTPLARHAAGPASEGLGVFVAAPPGTPVMTLELEAQAGPTRRQVTASTPPRLFTLHDVVRGGSRRTYLLAYDGIDFDVPPGASELDVGTPLGRVAARGSGSGLAIEVRQLRRGASPAEPLEQLLSDSSSLACDARNVLPLRP